MKAEIYYLFLVIMRNLVNGLDYNGLGINLKHLDLYDNQLIDISFLVRLTQLEYLNLSRNKIKFPKFLNQF